MAFGSKGLLRGVAFGSSGLLRGVAFGSSGLLRGVAFGSSGLLRGVSSLGGDNLVVCYYFNGSENWRDKRGGL